MKRVIRFPFLLVLILLDRLKPFFGLKVISTVLIHVIVVFMMILGLSGEIEKQESK